MGVGLGLGGGKGVGSTVIQVSKGPKYVLFLLSFSHSLVKTGRFTPRDLACWCFSFPLACTTADVFSFRLACTTAGVYSFRLACTTAGVFLFLWHAQLLAFCFYLGAYNCWFVFCCFSFFLFKIQTTSPHVDTVPEPRPFASRKVTLPASFFSLCSTSGTILHDLKTHRVLWRCGWASLSWCLSLQTWVQFRFGSPLSSFSSEVVVYRHSLVSSSSTLNQTLKWPTPAADLHAESSWLWQCSAKAALN